jgi:hypothetical protein
MIEEAKMGGITPDVLILSGRCVLCPPYIRLPTTRLAYCTGIRLCPCSTKIMKPTTATMRTRRITRPKIFISPVETSLKVFMIAAGIRATIPAKMIREIPFPMPRSVICSPSHIIKAVPAVRVKTVINRNPHPWCKNNGCAPRRGHALEANGNSQALNDTQHHRPIPGILSDFFLPCSPSFFNRSRWGITTVSS